MTKKTKSEAVVAAAFASSRDVTVTPRTEKPNFDDEARFSRSTLALASVFGSCGLIAASAFAASFPLTREHMRLMKTTGSRRTKIRTTNENEAARKEYLDHLGGDVVLTLITIAATAIVVATSTQETRATKLC